MKTFIFIFACILLPSVMLCQSTDQEPDQIVKATYLGKNLEKELAENIEYPKNTLMTSNEGDVVIKVVIDKNGKLQNPTYSYSSNDELGKMTLGAIHKLNRNWIPALHQNNKVSKSYLIVFRYRNEKNYNQNAFINRIDKMIRKQKYEQALEMMDVAIIDNRLEYSNYLKRAEIYMNLGMEDKAKLDKTHAIKLQSSVLAIVDFQSRSMIASFTGRLRTVRMTEGELRSVILSN